MSDIPPQNLSSDADSPVGVRSIVVFAIVLFVGAAVGLGVRLNHPAAAADSAKTVAPGTFRPTKGQWANLKTELVREMSFRTERTTEGNIAYNDDVLTQVFSPYTGRVSRVIAKIGDAVEKGAPLMAVAAAEFVQTRSDLIAARAQVTLAAASEKRQHELYLAKSGALKDWLQSQSDLTNAENNLLAARNRLRILGRSDDEIKELEEGKKTGHEKTGPESLVLAPISGTVIQRQVGVGQYINSAAGGASTPVYTIGDLSTVWIIGFFREADAPLMRVGQPAEVRVLAYPGRVYKANVAWVASSVDPTTHRLQVRAVVDNSDGSLKAQMFANFKIIAGEDSTSPGAPQSAIVYHGEEARVYVARDDGTIELRSIATGRVREDGMVEVVGKLKAGEKIVTRGTLFIDRATEEAEEEGKGNVRR